MYNSKFKAGVKYLKTKKLANKIVIIVFKYRNKYYT